MTQIEYYPTPTEILNALGMECVLVGSASQKPIDLCKDVDFVVSAKGLEILKRWDHYLTHDSPEWVVLIPLEDMYKCVEFFHGICSIVDKTKWSNRLTYEQAIEQPLSIRSVYGVDVLSLS